MIKLVKTPYGEDIKFELLYRNHKLNLDCLGQEGTSILIRPECEQDAEEFFNFEISNGSFDSEKQRVDLHISNAMMKIKSHIEMNTRIFCYLTNFKYNNVSDILKSKKAISEYNKIVATPAFIDFISQRFNKSNWDIKNAPASIREGINEVIIGFNNFFEAHPKKAIKHILGKGNFGDIERSVNKMHKTPQELVQMMLSKIPESILQDPNIKYLDPCCGTGTFIFELVNILEKYHSIEHIYKNMIYVNDCDSKYTLLTKIKIEQDYLTKTNEIICFNNSSNSNFLTENIDMKFDVIIGNPPYQKGNGSPQTIWDLFVERSLDILQEDGILCMVHPAGWRRPSRTDLFKKMAIDCDMLYLNINNDIEGLRVFGAGTRFDWYCLQKTSNPNTKTTVVDEAGIENQINMKDVTCVPNFGINIVGKILAKDNDEVLSVKRSQTHAPSRTWISRNEDELHPYKLYQSMTPSNGIKYVWSKTPHATQNLKKVVMSDSRHIVADYDPGVNGVSDHVLFMEVETDFEGSCLVNFFNSKLMQFIVKATKWSNFQIEYHMFKMFKKPSFAKIPSDLDIYEYFGISESEQQYIENVLIK